MAISEDDTDLRWSCTFSGEFADVVNDSLRCGLEPCWHLSRVWNGGGADTLSLAVKTTHGCSCVLSSRVSVGSLRKSSKCRGADWQEYTRKAVCAKLSLECCLRNQHFFRHVFAQFVKLNANQVSKFQSTSPAYTSPPRQILRQRRVLQEKLCAKSHDLVSVLTYRPQ